MTRPFRSPIAALALAGCVLAATSSGCRRARLKDPIAPAPTGSATSPVVFQPPAPPPAPRAEPVLPPATMKPAEVRRALWDIAARQRSGDPARVLDDYADRAQASKTLEARFLAAAAIPDRDTAWRAFKAIADEQPRFYWAHAGMASVYVGWKLRDQGEKELALCDELLPGLAHTRTLRGRLYRAVGDHAAAVREYQAALAIDAADSDARVGLALSRRALDPASLSDPALRAELERALRDLPTHYEAAEQLALLLDEQDRPAEARTAWERVEKLAPRNRGAKLALARLRGSDDPAGAIRAYEDAAKLQPLTLAEQKALARLYRDQGRADDEVRALETLTRLDPKDPAPWRRLAELHEKKGDQPAAERAWRGVLTLVDNDAAALYGLGRAAERASRIREALGRYRDAKAAGHERAARDLTRLSTECALPSKPLTGPTLTAFYRAVSASLERVYDKRAEQQPSLKGLVRVGIHTDGQGRALEVTVRENTLRDPFLEAHLYEVLQGARWPTLRADEPHRFTLTFDLPPVRE